MANLDEESRKKIRENTGVNYFVEAGAGSGKTTELVNRMVAMVENGGNVCRCGAQSNK